MFARNKMTSVLAMANNNEQFGWNINVMGQNNDLPEWWSVYFSAGWRGCEPNYLPTQDTKMHAGRHTPKQKVKAFGIILIKNWTLRLFKSKQPLDNTKLQSSSWFIVLRKEST